MESFLTDFGDEVVDADEETFLLFSRDIPSQNLGFVDPKATTVEVTVNGRDLVFHQSPSILSSKRSGGTTGAVLWKVTQAVAEWLASPKNALFRQGVLSETSTIIELGCGVNPLIPLALGSRIGHYVLTDQPYVAKLVELNLQENMPSKTSRTREKRTTARNAPLNINFTPVDWENDVVTSDLTGDPAVNSFDMVIGCDTIYNEALVESFVDTCADICHLRGAADAMPTIYLVAQQLRDSTVFEAWLRYSLRKFRIWRLPDEHLRIGTVDVSGFVVHIGILRM